MYMPIQKKTVNYLLRESLHQQHDRHFLYKHADLILFSYENFAISSKYNITDKRQN